MLFHQYILHNKKTHSLSVSKVYKSVSKKQATIFYLHTNIAVTLFSTSHDRIQKNSSGFCQSEFKPVVIILSLLLKKNIHVNE